jgi:hypothetical protein
MTNRKCVSGVLAVTLIFGVAAAVGAAEPKPPQLNPKVVELLSKYAGSDYATWGKENVRVYYIDPLRFDEFKTQIDALGKYQTGSRTFNRDWEQGKTFARWCARTNGSFQLELCKANNATAEYQYKKFPKAQGVKADELLRKYMAPFLTKWSGEDNTEVYFIDPFRFDAFKAELDALGEYVQKGNWNEDDYEKGKSRATWAVFPNDFECELQLQKGNSPPSTYWYEKSSAPKR